MCRAGFGTSSLTQSFSEPTGTGTTAVTLTVERSGGSVGVVSVSYAVTMAGVWVCLVSVHDTYSVAIH